MKNSILIIALLIAGMALLFIGHIRLRAETEELREEIEMYKIEREYMTTIIRSRFNSEGQVMKFLRKKAWKNRRF